jgi:hypothetical protein
MKEVTSRNLYSNNGVRKACANACSVGYSRVFYDFIAVNAILFCSAKV